MERGKNLKKEKLILLILIVAGILAISFLGFYFKSIIEKEKKEVRKELERILLEGRPISSERAEPTSPETLFRLRDEGIERYFLSRVELINNRYTPIISTCLYEKGVPLYPSYIYETSSLLDYPDFLPEIALVRYLLLTEDNTDFQPDKNCFIKEIKTEQDWREVEEKYNFFRNRF